ncbi:unnamed protein product, partial [Brachionus calyciflorus]
MITDWSLQLTPTEIWKLASDKGRYFTLI